MGNIVWDVNWPGTIAFLAALTVCVATFWLLIYGFFKK